MDQRLDTIFFQTRYLSIHCLSMTLPSLRTKHGKRLPIEVEEVVEGVQEVEEEGAGGLEEGEVGVGEEVRNYGA